MKNHFNHIIFVLTFFLSLITSIGSLACSCTGKDILTTETEFKNFDAVVKGTIISVSDIIYNDTVELSLSGVKFDSKVYNLMINKYKSYKITINKNYKASLILSDTITIITRQGGGDCGFGFEIGNEYIVYGEKGTEKEIESYRKRKKTKTRLIEKERKDMITTSICSLTQEANIAEIERLNKLTK